MAESPEDAVDLSDEELDGIVSTLEAEDGPITEDPDPDSQGTAAQNADVEAQGESTPADKSEAGEEVGPEKERTQAVPPKTEAPPPTTEPAKIEAGKPFQFKAQGGVHTFQGATELPDGSVVISKEANSELRNILASQRELSTKWRQDQREFQRQIRSAKEERTNKDIEADAVIKLFSDLKKMSPEERWEFFSAFEEKTPQLELEIQRQQLDRDRQALERERQGPELSEEEQVEQLRSTLKTELDATFERLSKHEAAKHLTKEDLSELRAKWDKKALKLVTRATEDDPESGVKKGDLVFDDEDVLDDFKDRVKVRMGTAKTVDAATRNAQLNADTNGKSKVPPTVRGGRTPAGDPKGKGEKDYRGKRKQFEKDFMAGKLDADE
jgi:hypothetical protein